MKNVKVKRIYEPYSAEDGYRILVDRLWPRGIKKDGAHIDKWMKDIGPSTALRKAFNHKPEKWNAFIPAYKDELKNSPVLKDLLSDVNKHPVVTLLYGARDTVHNHALVLQEFIAHHISQT
ncbi:MAG: DUF488 domain-containing protein [Bacteroidetes bacterium]|nr:DUF488 domain-containing protein [Bacteroidota bacterium]